MNHYHTGRYSRGSDSRRQVQMRYKRKFPYVPRKVKPHLYWPTYRGAVNWMRQHQEILDTAVGLLEIYPNIIADCSLDTLWEFMKPYLDMIPTPPKNVKNPHKQPKQRVVLPVVKPSIPMISITHDSDPEEDCDIVLNNINNPIKTVKTFVVGKLETNDQRDISATFVEQICSYAYVCYNTAANKSEEALREAEYFIFLLSDTSLSNADCCRKLVYAWSLDLPTIFVRSLHFKLPTPLPETFLQQTLRNDDLRISGDSGRHSITPSVGNRQCQPGKATIKRAVSATSGLKQETPTEHQPSFNSSNMVLDLINGYRDAIVFDDRFPVPAIQELRSCLNKSVDISRSCSSMTMASDDSFIAPRIMSPDSPFNHTSTSRGNFLSIPNTTNNSLHIDIGYHSDSSNQHSPVSLMVPDFPQNNLLEISHSDIDQDLDSGVHGPIEKDTFYVVYPDPMTSSNKNTSTLVKWPPDDDDLSFLLSPDSTRTLDSPITFNDIDLSNAINYDVFSPDSSITSL